MTLGRWVPRKSHQIKASVPLLRPRKTGRMGLRAQEGGIVTRSVAAPELAPEPATLVCSCVQDWLQQQAENFRSLLVPRPPWGPQAVDEEFQQSVDLVASAAGFGREECLQEEVDAANGVSATELSSKARRLASRAVRAGVPQSLAPQIQLDAEEICSVLVKMVPTAQRLIVKLELMGENVCGRWHQDNYVGRAIVTYNGCGTEYVRHEDVNFWELNNCGNPDHILRDKSQVLAVGPADIFFMKGKLFPADVNGLVHKSPEKRYHPNGAIMTRLCLKIDIP
jgi:hypothetical protein